MGRGVMIFKEIVKNCGNTGAKWGGGAMRGRNTESSKPHLVPTLMQE